MSSTDRDSRRQLWWSIATATAVVVSVITVPSYGDGHREGTLAQANEAAKASLGLPHEDPLGAPPHRHDDPATKNAVSRGGETGTATQDPTTAAQRRASTAYVARERALPDPQLTTVPATQPRTRIPQTRYAMANGCYSLATDHRPLDRFTFKPTDLGTYLLYAEGGRFLAGSNGAGLDPAPSPDAEWTVRKVGQRFTFTLPSGHSLATNRGSFAIGSTPARFALETAKGCPVYPESQVDVRGHPHAGVTDFQEVRGYVDGHTHGMAFEFLGGQVHCGRPWHKYGAPYALRDCPDHEQTRGHGALLETFFSGEPSHDPVGWPTFKDWPAPNSLTHEGTYYKWLERSWRGGQRLFVNLLVENNKLCEIYPLKRNSCDDMDSIRLQAKDMYAFQDYIDAQFGGPGKGFYRIVTSPWHARKVINDGKMAVVMGIETSVPFGCTFKAVLGNDIPACTAAQINRQLDEMHRLGVRQMELVNKFDNALAGVAGDAGTTGTVVNSANFLETGTFWDMRHCEPADGESSDKPQVALPDIGAGQQDALFGAIGTLFGELLPALPLYGRPAHCNRRGLTSLGAHTLTGLARRHMIFDPDHLSVKARTAAMDQLQRMGYPGVISSHSWSTPDTYPRIYRSGGFITPYAGDSTGFVEKWRRHLGWADQHYYFGFGYGADINGLGAQGNPRGSVPNKVTYPFTGLNGVRIERQRAGRRVYDINVDGVAQYGLYPDWIEDLRKVAGRDGARIVDDMARGAEAYLQMWERTEGVKPDSCRNPGLRKPVAKVKRLVRPGMSTVTVMRKVGQPYSRLGTTYGICAERGDAKVMVTIEFSRRGRVTGLRVS
ncbi:MAG: peptidase [Actinomycetota bacterium]|nr:peptidase [Actinomycetota bacterium]